MRKQWVASLSPWLSRVWYLLLRTLLDQNPTTTTRPSSNSFTPSSHLWSVCSRFLHSSYAFSFTKIFELAIFAMSAEAESSALAEMQGTLLPSGDIGLPNGNILLKNGNTLLPDGTTKLPNGRTLLPSVSICDLSTWSNLTESTGSAPSWDRQRWYSSCYRRCCIPTFGKLLISYFSIQTDFTWLEEHFVMEFAVESWPSRQWHPKWCQVLL